MHVGTVALGCPLLRFNFNSRKWKKARPQPRLIVFWQKSLLSTSAQRPLLQFPLGTQQAQLAALQFQSDVLQRDEPFA